MRYSMAELKDMIENAKNAKFLTKLRKQEEIKEEKKHVLRTVIIIATVVAALCAVAYFLYVYLCPASGLTDEDLDDEFEGDFFEEDGSAGDDDDADEEEES